jgi:hypothetical protein
MIGEDDREQAEGQQDWAAQPEEPLETERLALDGDGEHLPWLESSGDDYGEDDDAAGGGMARLLLFGVLALVVIVGGIWWATRQGGGDQPLADGSTIEAPPEPYKQAPDDPGGKTFDGTGDSSFAVSEGQTQTPQLEQSAPPLVPPVSGASSAAPVAPSKAPSAPAGTAPAPVKAAAPASGGVGVQVGAFSSKEAAEAGWSRLVGQSRGLLSGVSHRVIPGSADNGTVYRLQAVAGDAGTAQALCGKLKSAGIACQVK